MKAMSVVVAAALTFGTTAQGGRSGLELAYAVVSQDSCDAGAGDVWERFKVSLQFRNITSVSVELGLGAVIVNGVEIAATAEDLRARRFEYRMEGELPELRADRSVPWNVDPSEATPLIVQPAKDVVGQATVLVLVTKQPVLVSPGAHAMRVLARIRTRRVDADGRAVGPFEWRSVWSAPTRIHFPAKPKTSRCEGT